MLTLKISTYEDFNHRYPGYGGFLPDMEYADGIVKPYGDWENMLNSIHNGELFWAIYGLVEVLDVKHPSQKTLKKRWNDAMHRMIDTSIPIFYKG